MPSRTLAMIKPDVTGSTAFLDILRLIAEHGFTVREARIAQWSPDQARGFYREHAGKPFLDGLVSQMSSGPLIGLLLEVPGDDAVTQWRSLLGATDPTKASPGTIRARFGTAGAKNAGHGSDSPASARAETVFWFGEEAAARWFGPTR